MFLLKIKLTPLTNRVMNKIDLLQFKAVRLQSSPATLRFLDVKQALITLSFKILKCVIK